MATNPRYPLAFCEACLRDAATDSNGTPLDICEDRRMALAYRLGGADTWHPAATIFCRIRGQKAQVNQGRFGGIVAEPASGPAPKHMGVISL